MIQQGRSKGAESLSLYHEGKELWCRSRKNIAEEAVPISLHRLLRAVPRA